MDMKVNRKTKNAAPCLGCERREPGCHGKCEEYAEWLEPVLKARAARIKDSDAEGVRVEGIMKSRKRRRGDGKN